MNFPHRRTALALLILGSLAAVGCSGAQPRPNFSRSGFEPTKEPNLNNAYPPGSGSKSEEGPSLGQQAYPAAPPNQPGITGADEARSAPAGEAMDAPSKSARPEFRPGLATQWGEQRSSRVTSAPFARADLDTPFALGKLFYNDPQGIEAMSSGLSRMHRTLFPIGSGFVEIGVKDGSGRFVSGFTAGGSDYVTGSSGDRYSIVVKNRSPGRIEVVVSVDGLDVIDGQAASLAKRGYLLDAFGEVEIEGFRTSTSEVAAFRFGSVENSYAELKHGDSRNVGVIGIALFNERGDSPSNWPLPRSSDTDRRLDANPFPMQFAQPPR